MDEIIAGGEQVDFEGHWVAAAFQATDSIAAIIADEGDLVGFDGQMVDFVGALAVLHRGSFWNWPLIPSPSPRTRGEGSPCGKVSFASGVVPGRKLRFRGGEHGVHADNVLPPSFCHRDAGKIFFTLDQPPVVTMLGLVRLNFHLWETPDRIL